MASLQNRSPLVVTVAHRPKARREFRFDQPEKADEYMAELKAAAALDGKTIEVKLSQLDTSWEVRIRQRGYKPVNITAGSLADANKLVDKVKSDRAHGLVIDYTKAHHVTFAELMVMHIDKHKRPKTFGHDFYKVAAWLRDSGSDGVALLAAFQAEREAAGKPLPPLKFRVAQPMENLEWIHKKFAHLEAQDITDYVEAREDQVGPATVDREIDVFRLIVNRATKSWGYRVAGELLHRHGTLRVRTLAFAMFPNRTEKAALAAAYRVLANAAEQGLIEFADEKKSRHRYYALGRAGAA